MPDNIGLLPDGRMNTEAAAAYLGLSIKTLAMKRCDGTGPKFVKVGRIFYFRADLDEWLQSLRVTSTTELAKRRTA
jgi:hypothetical protein